MLYAAIVRSPEAHARIVSIDTEAAKARPGVEAVFTGEDMADMAAPCPMVWVPPGVEVNVPDHWPLARGKVGYVGQAVAVVLGTDKYAVVDAAEDVIVEYDPLPVVTDPEAALEDGAPIIHEEFGTNKVFEWSLPGGDVEGAFRDADVVVEKRIVNHRTAGAAIEPRGALAEWRQGKLTLWSSTQIPHIARVILSIQLGITEDKIRVVAPEVGGGFGSKLQVYGEEVLACWCAIKTGMPVKWTATRSDEMAVDAPRARPDRLHPDRRQARRHRHRHPRARSSRTCGSYHLIEGPVIPTFSACVIAGCYKFAAVQTDIVGVFTNKFTTDAIRGAGRPEATHMIELTMDALADELGMDRLELRRKNFITEFPYELPHGFIYDSGNYDGTLDRCLEKLDLDAFRREQEELRGARRLPRRRLLDLRRDLRPRAVARARARRAGACRAATSSPRRCACTRPARSPSTPAPRRTARGSRPSFAQIVADRLGVDPEVVDVIHGDTNTGPFGKNTYGSRSLAVGGEAIARAAEKVQDKAKRIVAHQLEAAPEDIELADGSVPRRGLARQGDDARGGRGRGLHPAGPARGHGGRASTRSRSTTRRTSSGRSARTRASPRSTSRPGAWTSSATSRSTTAARRSTRC